ncbi:DUF2264 domain-containing protein [Streptomyces sp. 3214.6]|uniref:DUF2264 domain-containing protein n=1 Tax=Streptomyces sp. 3214.6 TaxID=1882757 RepID=UPI0026CC283A
MTEVRKIGRRGFVAVTGPALTGGAPARAAEAGRDVGVRRSPDAVAFTHVTQPYSGPASPYWASKAFLGLLLPADHPVWTAREEAGPVDTADRRLALPAPGWLLHSTAADGIVRLVNYGADRLPPRPPRPTTARTTRASPTPPPPRPRPHPPANHQDPTTASLC